MGHSVKFAFSDAFEVSTVIEDTRNVCEARSALMTYFCFNLRDISKQGIHSFPFSRIAMSDHL
jgi:hypothetical protein